MLRDHCDVQSFVLELSVSQHGTRPAPGVSVYLWVGRKEPGAR